MKDMGQWDISKTKQVFRVLDVCILTNLSLPPKRVQLYRKFNHRLIFFFEPQWGLDVHEVCRERIFFSERRSTIAEATLDRRAETRDDATACGGFYSWPVHLTK